MFKMKKIKLFLIIFSFLFIALKPIGYLNDFANLLTQNQKQEIEKKLREIEEKTGNEIVVLTIKSLEREKTIEEYANEIFNSWKIGKKGKDNGVLILIVLNERKIRIEVGYGLEGLLTDSICGKIIRDIMAPNFKENDFYNGINKAIGVIYEIMKGKDVEIKEEKNIPPIGFFLYWYFMCILFGYFFAGLLGLSLELFIILFLQIFTFINRNTYLYQPYILFSLFIPFFFLFILLPISYYISVRFERKLKKYYGKKWKKHIPFYLRNHINFTSSKIGYGGGFSGGFGGFGGGASGGGGATGRW
ncbi:MAG: TPM domain-containing protein [Candidatus Omnitrophica bacterium]|nr:TPM domain-containing protein [Candidatus Omnitrophota bacterium]